MEQKSNQNISELSTLFNKMVDALNKIKDMRQKHRLGFISGEELHDHEFHCFETQDEFNKCLTKLKL